MTTHPLRHAAALLSAFMITSSPLPSVAAADTSATVPMISTIATNLGVQVERSMIMRSDCGKNPDGRAVLYTVILGNPAIMSVVDVENGSVLKNLPLPDTSGAWAVKVAPDNTVYVGAYNQGLLYRYFPETGELKNLGNPLPTNDAVLYPMDIMPDGKVYGGSYSSGHGYEYNPDNKKFRDLGQMTTSTEREHWIRVTVADPINRKLYLGIGNKPQLVEYDLDTGKKRELLSPKYANITAVYDLNLAGGRLFCRKETHNPDEYFVLDVATGKDVLITNADTGETTDVFLNMSRGLSPVAPGTTKMYYSDDQRQLCEYDLATNTIRQLGFNTASALTGYSFVKLDQQKWPGLTLAGTVGNQEKIYRYNLQTGKGELQDIDLPGQPVNIRDIIAGPDGNIYTGGYLAGNMGRFNPETSETTHFSGSGQTEGMTFIGNKLYSGVYPDAQIYEFDTSRPWNITGEKEKNNPRKIFSLTKHPSIPGDIEQDRPWAMAGSQAMNKLFVGTTPKNGMLGGVLAIWDTVKQGEPEVHWNIVPDQSIVSLVVKDGLVYGGSSITGGMGIKPRATEAEFFIWDPAQKKKIYSKVPVPGAATVSALGVGPDGKIWGFASGTLFVFDPEKQDITYTKKEFPSANSDYRDGSFVTHTDGNVYGTAYGTLFKIDPKTMKLTQIAKGASTIVQDIQGRLYTYGEGRTILYQYIPEI